MRIKEKINDLFVGVLEENTSYYSIGDSVKFLLPEVTKDNNGKEIPFDNGMIVDKNGMNYIVRLDNGEQIIVKNEYAYAFGNSDADPA